MTGELENEDVGYGLNIPGKVIDEGCRCEMIDRVNAFMGAVGCAFMASPWSANNGRAIADTQL